MKKFLTLALVLLAMLLSVTVMAQAVPEEPTTKVKIFTILRELDVLNIVLMIFGTLFAALYKTGRDKLKMLGEFALKLHEYTGDRRLDEKERADILNRITQIIGGNNVIIRFLTSLFAFKRK